MDILPALEKWGALALIFGFFVKEAFQTIRASYEAKKNTETAGDSVRAPLPANLCEGKDAHSRQLLVEQAIIEIGRQAPLQTELLKQCVEKHEKNLEIGTENAQSLTRIEIKLDERRVHVPPNGRAGH